MVIYSVGARGFEVIRGGGFVRSRVTSSNPLWLHFVDTLPVRGRSQYCYPGYCLSRKLPSLCCSPSAIATLLPQSYVRFILSPGPAHSSHTVHTPSYWLLLLFIYWRTWDLYIYPSRLADGKYRREANRFLVSDKTTMEESRTDGRWVSMPLFDWGGPRRLWHAHSTVLKVQHDLEDPATWGKKKTN